MKEDSVSFIVCYIDLALKNNKLLKLLMKFKLILLIVLYVYFTESML